ncbi:ATP-binding cassette domain-containing protein [Polyangium sp. 6x1]|uniref:ATP-binding cassette domain-containing protein n=1 Tax=Polyangium sp. 6x1 TaxID=3042689 RepID=UPI002482C503|nr:ATP-binding cassette domain-containing protein [Polyangium sp. 6x1]MDI1450987.1 ATP-binding cassette domain-containing protein [Polyangium sp. 6x1]
MLSLHALRVAFSHGDATSLLEDVELHLGPGWTGIVGENGTGKTTLLRLLAGVLRPERGHVRRDPAEARVVLCPQTVDSLSDSIARFAEDLDGEAAVLRGRLDLVAEDLERWPTLSPGERKRWQIGAALFEAPEILMLDEPANHLDAEARRLLVGALRRFDGVGLLVSHDRALLDALTTTTLRIHQCRVHLYRGRYADARSAWEAESAHARDEREAAKNEEKRAARRLDQARREHAMVDASRSMKNQMKNKNDHDGRGMLRKIAIESAEKRAGRSVGVARAELARASAELSRHHVEKELGGEIYVGWERPTQPWPFVLDLPVLRAGETELVRDVRLSVPRDGRIRIEGRNGAGKSTLLGALAAASRIPKEQLLYLPQDLPVEARRALLAEVRALDPEARGRTLSLVATLGTDPERILASAEPSPGEARKLAIALGLGRRASALLLDEPENHLDLPSLERLERALEGYPGAIVMVSHDASFARRATRTVWRIEQGRVRELDAAQGTAISTGVR